MSKNTLIGIIVIIIAIIVVVSFSKSKPKEETQGSVQQEKEEITPATLDESMKSTIEKLKPTCSDFLVGDLSGDPYADCPGFENPINKNLCFYCYATKNQNPTLCETIDNDSGFKIVCQRATGSSVDEILNK